MTQSSPSSDLETVRKLLFGAEVERIDQALTSDRQASAARAAELDQKVERALAALEARMEKRLEELSQRVTSQLDDLAKRQQAHADKATQLLDQVMAELSRRTDALTAETRKGLDELRARAAELEKRKLNVAEFGASLAALGQRFASGEQDSTR